MQGTVGHHLGDERVEARLRHRAAAAADLIDLGGVDVNSPDVMATGGKAGGGYRPALTKADYCDLHLVTSHKSDTRDTRS